MKIEEALLTIPALNSDLSVQHVRQTLAQLQSVAIISAEPAQKIVHIRYQSELADIELIKNALATQKFLVTQVLPVAPTPEKIER